MSKSERIIDGGVHTDYRGSLRYVNEFDFQNSGVRRFYMVENASIDTVRGFHGHMYEQKYVHVVSGAALVCIVPLTDVDEPSKEVEVERYVLSADQTQILHIPGGFANGFRALEEGTKVIFYSTSTLQESLEDEYRYPNDYWGDIWNLENL